MSGLLSCARSCFWWKVYIFFMVTLTHFNVYVTKDTSLLSSIYGDSQYYISLIFCNFQRWELIEPLIRQQDLCLAISAFSPGSKVKMEPCNAKEVRQVRQTVSELQITLVKSTREDFGDERRFQESEAARLLTSTEEGQLISHRSRPPFPWLVHLSVTAELHSPTCTLPCLHDSLH